MASDQFVATFRPLVFILFVLFSGIALGITMWARRKVQTTSQYYAAGSRMSGFVNGLAIGGDYMSAASFLGVAGLISFYGQDGVYYAVGFLAGWILALVFAEAIRRTGKLTAGEIITSNYPGKAVAGISAISSIIISAFYMIPQMVGAGSIGQALIGIPYSWSVILIGVLVIIIVLVGGMVGTTYVQFVKAWLILVIGISLMIMTWMALGGGNPITTTLRVAGSDITAIIGGERVVMSGNEFLSPGHYFKNPLDILSLSVGLVLGTMSLPHVLVRYLTVSNTREARKSTLYAVLAIGTFYIVTIFIGLGAASLDTRYLKNNNLSAPLLALYFGGDPFFAFVASITFVVIVGTVAGLMISASGSLVRDLLKNLIGVSLDDKKEVVVARFGAVIIGIFAIVIGIVAGALNVAFLVGLAFAVAASCFLPGMISALILKRQVPQVITATAMSVGLISSIGLICLSPTILGNNALFPLNNPGIVSIPLAFVTLGLGSLFASRKERRIFLTSGRRPVGSENCTMEASKIVKLAHKE